MSHKCKIKTKSSRVNMCPVFLMQLTKKGSGTTSKIPILLIHHKKTNGEDSPT